MYGWAIPLGSPCIGGGSLRAVQRDLCLFQFPFMPRIDLSEYPLLLVENFLNRVLYVGCGYLQLLNALD